MIIGKHIQFNNWRSPEQSTRTTYVLHPIAEVKRQNMVRLRHSNQPSTAAEPAGPAARPC